MSANEEAAGIPFTGNGSTLSTGGDNTKLYGSTPGGTRITYSVDELIHLSKSPLSSSPPANLSKVPPNLRSNGSGNGNVNVNVPSRLRNNSDTPSTPAAQSDLSASQSAHHRNEEEASGLSETSGMFDGDSGIIGSANGLTTPNATRVGNIAKFDRVLDRIPGGIGEDEQFEIEI